MRRLILPAACAAVLLLAGCGGSDDGAPPASGDRAAPATDTPTADGSATGTPPSDAPAAPTVDACSLVTKKEAEQLAGTKLQDAVPVRETCTYTGPVTGPTAQVEVFVGDGAKKFLDIERELGHDLKPLPGVGDEAYAEDGAVFVQASGVWFSIRLVRLDDPAKFRQPLADLARTAAGRI
ncbi:DUF3558 domain-containing protein [Micromonospora sp. DR5-3]|uniref:DUF3558 family protein n=1 Tax=unclassified Micromonospora TaxID=2617518 RepID=UPI0011D82CB2|nr:MULTISPECIES: DUF3558 family protein [unclassified Micromonospora]MCW3815847.1 DUF3558 domain-containing protein [Micromonospora sp. DR5-3]TYC24364.1 DUF3558 domain-containing protein [Micromonospora sp. MP36]